MRTAAIVVLVVLVVAAAGAGIYFWKGAGGTEYGNFSGSPLVELGPDGRSITLKAPFAFVDRDERTWDVPEGYTADGASIPRFFWTLVGAPLEGRYRDASIIHDYYCEKFDEPWPDAYKRHWKNVHRAFYYGMRARGVDEVKAKMMYGAVYHFGPRWDTEGNQVRKIESFSVGGQDINPDEELIDYIEKNNPSLEEIEGHVKENQGVVRRPQAWQEMRAP